MATIKEIAEMAGVSRGTVDRVINNRGAVNPATEKKILDIIEQLDFQPNKAGVALAAQKKKLRIGLVLFHEDNPYFNQVEEGLRESMEAYDIYGFHYEIIRCNYDPDEQYEALQELAERGVDGLMLAPCDDIRIRELIDDLGEQGVPTVTFNTDVSGARRIAYVGADNAVCGQTGAALIGLLTGRQARVGIVSGSEMVLGHNRRIKYFTQYKAAGVEIKDVIRNHDDDAVSHDRVYDMLTEHPDIDTLFFTSGGVHGGCLGLIDYEKDHPDYPKPVVVAFDDVPTTVEMVKADVVTACICQQPVRQGAVALEVMARYLLSQTLPEQDIIHTELSIKIKESMQ